MMGSACFYISLNGSQANLLSFCLLPGLRLPFDVLRHLNRMVECYSLLELWPFHVISPPHP